MNIIRTAGVVAWALLMASPAQAKDEGFYLGAGAGVLSMTRDAPVELAVDDTTAAFKLFGGYQFSELFAVEGGFRDLGSPSSKTARIDLQAYDLFGVVGVPIGPIRVFAKGGGIYRDASIRIKEGGRTRDTGLGYAFGAGLEFEVWSLAGRAEIEKLDIFDDTLMYSVGLTLTL